MRLLLEDPLIDMAPRLELGNTTFKWDGGSRVEQMGSQDIKWKTHPNARPTGMFESGVYVNLPKTVRRVTIVQEFYLKNKGVYFDFRDVSLSSLPITRKCGKAEMTMVSAAIRTSLKPEDKLNSPNANVRPGQSFLLIKLLAKYPDGFFRDESLPMCSSGDKELTYMSNWDDNPGEDYPLPPGIPARKPSGKLVTVHEYYAYEAMSMPSQISFDPGVQLPPDPKDTVKVTFENVPVPAR